MHQRCHHKRLTGSFVIANLSLSSFGLSRFGSSRIKAGLALLALLSLPTIELQAEEDEEDSSGVIALPMPAVTARIDGAHTRASKMLEDFASELDNFFGEEVDSNVINKTRATIRTDLSRIGDEGFNTSAKLKLRLVLPRSQQRIKLLLDVDEKEDDESIQQVTADDTDRDFAFAFRFIRNFKDIIRFDFDLGARRFDDRYQTFARVRASTTFTTDESWSFNLNNDYRQYYSSGFANRTSFNCWHPVTEDRKTMFRASTNFSWQEIERGVQIDQTVGIYKDLEKKSLLAFELLAGYDTSPNEGDAHYNGHTARIRYRKNIYRPWLHYEVWPSVSWLTEDDSDASLGALVRLEVQLGNNESF